MSYTTSLTNCSHRELGLDELDAISGGLNHVDGTKVLVQASAFGAVGALIGGAAGTVAGGPGGAIAGGAIGTLVGAAAGAAYEILSELF